MTKANPNHYYMPDRYTWWPAWVRHLWRFLFRWRMYERGYVDGFDAAERVAATRER